MKLNLTVDLLMTTATVILSTLVYVDHCSARTRPMAPASTSLAKVGNLAADHLSALQQTGRKVTKSSVLGINWKNVLLLAGLKAGIVGAKIVKKKVAYKKLKGLKSIGGFDPLLGGSGFQMNGWNSFPSMQLPQSSQFIFRPDNKDHIIDVNRNQNNPFEYDQVNIICPNYSKGTRTDQAETYIIYNVSNDEYDQCRINSNSSRVIAICNKPHQMMYFTITFRSFTPQPGGLEFHPGKDYYFITTSTGNADGLERKVGGRCSTHHMKITFRVCCGNDRQPSSSTANNNLQTINNRPSNAEATPASSVDRLTNSLDDSQSNSNPMQSLFKKLLPHSADSASADQVANQIPSTGQHNLQFELPDKNSALYNNRPNYVASSTVMPSVPVTPYWWRPHLSKLPTLKHQSLIPFAEMGSPSGSHNVNSLNQFTLNSLNNQQQPGSKSDVWVVVTGGCVAVVVAFLIVGILFSCTNYLFFPTKRKPASPCTTLQTQTLSSPAFAQQYALHTQHHFEYPMQHTIIK